MSAERIEPPNPHGRYRYGSWRGGPDPLAPPFDVRAAVDKIGADLLSAGNLRDSLRELLRRGLDGRGGLDRLAERIARLRAQARRRGDLGGTLDQVRAALDQALAAERETLAGTEGDDARFAEMELDTLPDDVAGAVRALEPYDWRSDEARATYQSILEMLRREVLDAQFAGMKQALESADPEAMQRVKDMLADLNALLAAHARNEDTTDAFRDFMAKHGEFFPEQPENVEELIDALARRQAAAQRMLASLSPEQREQLGQLMSRAMGDADLAAQMAQLSDNLRSLRPGAGPGVPAGMRPGGESLGYSDAVQAVAELADLEALQAQLPEPGRVHPRRRRRGPARAAPRGRGGPGLPGAARPGAGAGAAGLPEPRRGRAAAHPPCRTPARPDRAAPGLRPAGRGRARRPRRPADRGGRRADRADPAVGVRRRAAHRRAPDGGQRAAAAAARRDRCDGSTSRTSRSPRPNGGPRRRWRCASTCPSRWSRTGAGDR